MRYRIIGWNFAVMLVISALLQTVAEASDQSALPNQVTGRLLVAVPKMPDPRFRNTIILMIEHNKNGALGLIINRPLGFAEFEMESKQEGADILPKSKTLVFSGGPVKPRKSFIIHTTDYENNGTVKIAHGVWMTANLGILHAIASGKGPKKILHVIGYSGWSPGQLETEMSRDDWHASPVTPELVFNKNQEGKWEKALEERYRDL